MIPEPARSQARAAIAASLERHRIEAADEPSRQTPPTEERKDEETVDV